MPVENEFKDLIKQYLDNGISRRHFLTTLTGIGLSVTAANTLAKEFSPFVSRKDDGAAQALPAWARHVSGSGGLLLIEQLKASGHKFLFVNPSSGEAPIFDALVDEPDIQIIKSIHEGALVAMADGYAKATGETPCIIISRPGIPNAMSMMFNSWKDYTPMLVITDDVSVGMLSQDGFEAMDHMTSMTQTMTKWHWSIQAANKIPEILRRGQKFASTLPSGPVFLAIPADHLSTNTEAAVIDQDKYSVPMQLRPSQEDVKQAAKLLLNADNPLILSGDEVRYCQAQSELLALAELLGIPVVDEWSASWSKNFPTRHPLYIGNYKSTSRFPGKVDVMLNLGSRMPLAGSTLRIESQVKLIQVRVDADNLARVYPTELAIIADIKLTIVDLIEELQQQSSPRKLKRVANARLELAKAHRVKHDEVHQVIAEKKWDNYPISAERVVIELENTLEKDSVIVSDNDSYQWPIAQYLSYGPKDKDYYFSTGFTLGWGLPAAFGVKLAMPDRPVVCLVSDGTFLFSGPQPLWSYSRYRAPVLIIVMNNFSYNNERNRIMSRRGRSYETGRDMVCYLGDPDVDYVKLAAGFGVDGEIVDKPEEINSAIKRGMKATVEGRAYLLDMHVERTGTLTDSTWHPEYHINAIRTRDV
ncbi:MAG: thiamine pyrophosphate-dependent acetolactate synthase large subunit-like protein [Gammaproteobacteria bacterium]|jgi:thiamine pyrophosphate-dependent acetolactate synthase large subunit-like protein